MINQELGHTKPTVIVECGSCSGWHRVDFKGDCREDKERFASPEQAANRLKSNVQIAYDDDGKISMSSEVVKPGSDDT